MYSLNMKMMTETNDFILTVPGVNQYNCIRSGQMLPKQSGMSLYHYRPTDFAICSLCTLCTYLQLQTY